jgi:aspartyl-tRNA(Asn)/glutamyl-tRNA(Gln) amidotransferase subunit A
MNEDATRLDLHQLHAAYAEGRLEPVGVLCQHLARADIVAPALRAVITRMDALALEQAHASAERWRAGRPLGLLDGIPVGLKDNIAVAGVPCSAGTAALKGWVPSKDAGVVTRLREAGAVLTAKLNLHEAALGATTANPVFGDCQNPLRPGFTPGGSSGGSAAAVAAGLCTVALGTDTMGSVRIPAAYCGLHGYKPALGEVPLDGIVPLSTTLDSCGPLARSARDALAVAAVLAGRPAPVVALPAAAQGPDGWLQRVLQAVATHGVLPERALRIGLPTQVSEAALQPSVAAAWRAAQHALTRQGARLVPLAVPAWEPLALRRAALLVSEMEGGAWWEERLGPQLEGLSGDLQSMLRFPHGLGADKRERAHATVQAVREQASTVFDEVDLLLLPTTPQPAFAHGAAVPPDQGDFTTLANALGAAALSFPVPVEGGAVDVLPVACQLVGPRSMTGWGRRDA